MAFWSNSNSLHEPLRQYRWYIDFGSASGLNEHIFALKTCSKPSYKIDISEHVLINHTFRFPKNLVWQPVSVTMAVTRDDKGKTLSKAFNDAIKRSGYLLPSMGQQQISKRRQSSTIGTIQLKQLDANGNIIEDWCLCNPMFSEVNYGDLSYDNEGIVELKYVITYDYVDFSSVENTSAISELDRALPIEPIQSETDRNEAPNKEAATQENPPPGSKIPSIPA